MFKVITKDNPNEVWASGFYSRETPEKMIKENYWHQFMYAKDKHKTLIVVEETKTPNSRK